MRDYEAYSDEQLIKACRSGDQLAWNQLIDRYQRLVYTIPVRYGLNPGEVNDVFQSVWLALLRNLDALNQPDRVAAWLVTTARRECWERRRGAEYERELGAEPEPLLAKEASDTPPPEEVVAEFERHNRMRKGLSQLDDRCRELLWHLYYNQNTPSYSEISKLMEVPIGSIGPMRGRCLDKLRQILEEED